jgi:hypothetical protein
MTAAIEAPLRAPAQTIAGGPPRENKKWRSRSCSIWRHRPAAPQVKTGSPAGIR